MKQPKQIQLNNKKIKVLIDYNGYDICTYDYVIIENNETTKTFLVKYSPTRLAFGFISVDNEKKFYTLDEIKGLFAGKYTITKIGSCTIFE